MRDDANFYEMPQRGCSPMSADAYLVTRPTTPALLWNFTTSLEARGRVYLS
jgi:hypothetical protein